MQVANGIYEYGFDTKERNYGITIYGNTIYYYLEKDYNYEFYSINLFTNETKKIGEYNEGESYCYFDKEYIECDSIENKTLLNFKLKKIYEGKDKVVVPYKKSLLKVKDNVIYYKDKKYKTITKDLTNSYYYRHELFDDNIYLFFAGETSEEDCILNIEEGICEKHIGYGPGKYENGFYFYDKDKIYVIDNSTKDEKEYTNYTENEFLTETTLSEKKLFYFDNKYLKIYNLENGKVSLLDYKIKESVNKLLVFDKVLYILADNKIYVIKLDEISLEEKEKSEIKELLEKKLTDRINNLKSEYDIDVKKDKGADLKFPTLKEKITGEREYGKIDESLDYIKWLANIMGHDFFKKFIHDEYKGLKIYIVNKIEATMSMSGEAFRYYNNYVIVADTDDFQRTLCHEIMHSLEDAAETSKKITFTPKWESFNPKGFKYKNSYDEYVHDYKYTPNYKGSEVYFIDNYAQTNGLEDRARIFENICMNTTSTIKENKHLMEKAKYLKEEILKYYPMLKETTIFDSLG